MVVFLALTYCRHHIQTLNMPYKDDTHSFIRNKNNKNIKSCFVRIHQSQSSNVLGFHSNRQRVTDKRPLITHSTMMMLKQFPAIESLFIDML